MTSEENDSGIVQVLLQHLTHQQLPRAIELKERVDRGERLGDADIGFLEQLFAEADSARTIMARHPELNHLAQQLCGLYHEITGVALENERKAR